MYNNARYDRPTDTFDLEVNVPRTIGILRDASPMGKYFFIINSQRFESDLVHLCLIQF